MPTLGFVDRVSPLSGRLSVFTDSSCLDTASASLTKCFWLIEKLVRLSCFEDVNSTIMSERYRLPKDYTANEKPRKERVEDIKDVEVYRQGKLHSWDQQCRVKSRHQYNESDQKYEHEGS